MSQWLVQRLVQPLAQQACARWNDRAFVLCEVHFLAEFSDSALKHLTPAQFSRCHPSSVAFDQRTNNWSIHPPTSHTNEQVSEKPPVTNCGLFPLWKISARAEDIPVHVHVEAACHSITMTCPALREDVGDI